MVFGHHFIMVVFLSLSFQGILFFSQSSFHHFLSLVLLVFLSGFLCLWVFVIFKEELPVVQNMMFGLCFFDGDVLSWQPGLISFIHL